MKLFPRIEFSKELYARFYRDEFELPSNIHLVASVEDEQGIIAQAGIRPIHELIVLTDKSRTPLERKEALDLGFVKVVQCGLDLHVFVQDKKWKNRVMKSFGFIPTKGEALFLKVK